MYFFPLFLARLSQAYKLPFIRSPKAGLLHASSIFYRLERSENLITASKHAELVRKVESLAALTDSNRLLRDEKDSLAGIVESAKAEAEAATAKVKPLEAKVSDLEEKLGTLGAERLALNQELQAWKKRSDQLVEKSFKMNPEELKRLQVSRNFYTILT